MEKLLSVSPSPHLHSPRSTRGVMLDVIIALLPCVVAGAVIFGFASLFVVAFCVILCVAFEAISRLIMRRKQTVGDLSAVVTGMLLGLSLPVSMAEHLHLCIVGAFAAIVVAKQMFGGIGNNFVNPALVGRIVMLVSFPAQMTDWRTYANADAITGATPLGKPMESTSLLDLFFGMHGGCIGETCAIAILIGLVYLLIRRVIKPIIPLCYVGTVAAFSALSCLWSGEGVSVVLFQVLSGGLLFGAVFMATDYVTSPVTNQGKVIYAVGCGLITVLIRMFAALPEGVSYAIVLMNITVPLIERIPPIRFFGKKGGAQ